MKLFFLLSIVSSLCANAQTITRNGVIEADFKYGGNVIMDNTSAANTTTIRASSISTPKQLQFIDPIVILDQATLTCDRLEFAATVNTVRFSGDVKIQCRELSLPAGGLFIFENAGVAKLTLIATGGLPAVPARNITINDTGGFKVSIGE